MFLANKIKLEFNNKEEINDKKNRDDDIINFIYSAETWIILFGFVIGIVVDCYFYPCLTNHLTYNYGLSISIASLFFTVPIIVYIITVGILNHNKKQLGVYITYSIGLISTTLGPLFVYPITILPKKLFFVLFGLFLIGAGQAPIFVQGFVLLTNIIRTISKNKNEIFLNDISSTLNNITIDIGGFIGPIIGGFLTTKYNFNICSFIMFIVSCIYLIIFLMYFIRNIKIEFNDIVGKKELAKDIIDDNNEKEMLIEKNEEK